MNQILNTITPSSEHNKGHQKYQKFSSFFSRFFSTDNNPFYNLGAMAVIMFAVACISGIYIFIFYNINPRMAWESVEAMSGNFFNGWMRSIHRYSSDFLIVFMILHLIHTLIVSKSKRKLAWISGVISIMVVIIIGITGFILVWDQKAKLTGYLTAKLFSGLPIFDPSIAGAFLMNDLTTIGGFFKVAVFGHIALSLLVIIIIYIHVMRISKPKLFPPKKLTYYTLIALTIICFAFPVKSDSAAQLSNLPTETTFDWYYYFGFYFMKIANIGVNWLLLIAIGGFLAAIPFIFKRKDNEPVKIDLDLCDGCNLCAYDCPYEAIDMMQVEGERKAILSPDKCVGCNICIGSCHTHAISHDLFPELNLAETEAKVDVTLFSCSYFPEPQLPEGVNVNHYRVPCIGSVYPRDVQDILDNNSEKVALLSCEDCYYRLGKKWTLQRFFRKRAPLISRKYDSSRVKLLTLNKYTPSALKEFSKAPIEEDVRKGEFVPEDYKKENHIISTIVMILLFALMIPLSSTTVRFFDSSEKTLIINFKYISSPEEFEDYSSSASHMKSLEPVVKKRSNVMLRVFSTDDNKLIYEKEYKPRGLRGDIAMFIYSQLIVEQNSVNIELQEVAFPEIKYEIKDVKMKSGDGTFVIFKENELKEVKAVE